MQIVVLLITQTMETGSIARWNLKEGDKFEPGTAICEVETDKVGISGWFFPSLWLYCFINCGKIFHVCTNLSGQN